MSYNDLLRCYDLMIKVHNRGEALRFWSIVYNRINGHIFDSFSELNHAVLESIQDFKDGGGQQQQQQQQYTSKKRSYGGELISEMEPVQKQFKRMRLN